MASEAALTQLRDLGFNQLEAEVYVHLLANPPATAYAIGKRLGRPTANVYKAVDALSRRGAVLIEEGDNRLCRAVPADEFLDQLQRDFRNQTERTARTLAKLERQTEDERVYRLESVPQLFERCRQMLEERCEHCAVIDAFPLPLRAILPAIEGAIARGVRVYVEAYEPTKIKGADVVVADVGPQVLEQWRSQQLNVVVDGRESLTALLDAEMNEVHQGLWTNSLYLSCLMHSGRLAEHTLIRLRNAPDAKLRAVLKSHSFLLNSAVSRAQRFARAIRPELNLRENEYEETKHWPDSFADRYCSGGDREGGGNRAASRYRPAHRLRSVSGSRPCVRNYEVPRSSRRMSDRPPK